MPILTKLLKYANIASYVLFQQTGGNMFDSAVIRETFIYCLQGVRDRLLYTPKTRKAMETKIPWAVLVPGMNWRACHHLYPWLTEEYLANLGIENGRRFSYTDREDWRNRGQRNLRLLHACLNDHKAFLRLAHVGALIILVTCFDENTPELDHGSQIQIITVDQRTLNIDDLMDMEIDIKTTICLPPEEDDPENDIPGDDSWGAC